MIVLQRDIMSRTRLRSFEGRLPMISKATTLGTFVADLMKQHGYTNRALAAAAGISESAVRNLLKVGVDRNVKDPDARTLTAVAQALEVDAIRLFRLANYLPATPAAHSTRAEYLADIFDELPSEKQDAVLGVLDAIVDNPKRRESLRQMRENPANPLAGIDEASPYVLREIANDLITRYSLLRPQQADTIPEDAVTHGIRWRELDARTQERVKALIRHKVALDYDPTMVDDQWR
jgi:transcriptional regulator with XRE-family HTH domain